MDALVTLPLFGYRVNYRRVLEIQARLLARVLTGEIGTYPVFMTRCKVGDRHQGPCSSVGIRSASGRVGSISRDPLATC